MKLWHGPCLEAGLSIGRADPQRAKLGTLPFKVSVSQSQSLSLVQSRLSSHFGSVYICLSLCLSTPAIQALSVTTSGTSLLATWNATTSGTKLLPLNLHRLRFKQGIFLSFIWAAQKPMIFIGVMILITSSREKKWMKCTKGGCNLNHPLKKAHVHPKKSGATFRACNKPKL